MIRSYFTSNRSYVCMYVAYSACLHSEQQPLEIRIVRQTQGHFFSNCSILELLLQTKNFKLQQICWNLLSGKPGKLFSGDIFFWVLKARDIRSIFINRCRCDVINPHLWRHQLIRCSSFLNFIFIVGCQKTSSPSNEWKRTHLLRACGYDYEPLYKTYALSYNWLVPWTLHPARKAKIEGNTTSTTAHSEVGLKRAFI